MHNYQYYGTKVNTAELKAFIHHFFQTKLTRMLHVTLEFDLKTWVQWAEQNEVDARGINFVLLYPEIITGNAPLHALWCSFLKPLNPSKT